MKQQTRELLVTTKVAQNWLEDFDQRVDELMSIVSKVDNERHVSQSAELMDVYNNITHSKTTVKKRKLAETGERPFEFLVFRN